MSAIEIFVFYVILSVSEISHDLSDKAYTATLLRWDSSLRSE